jgi:hypothetical protein
MLGYYQVLFIDMRFFYSVNIILLFGFMADSSVVIKNTMKQRELADASLKFQNSIQFLGSVNVSDVVSADDFGNNVVVGDRRDLSDAGDQENSTVIPEIRLPPARRHLQTRRSLQHRLQLHEFVNDSLHEFADFLSKRDLLDDLVVSGDLVNTTTTTTTTTPQKQRQEVRDIGMQSRGLGAAFSQQCGSISVVGCFRFILKFLFCCLL